MSSLLPQKLVHVYRLPTSANLGQRFAPFCLFKILNIEPLKLALEAKDLPLGLHCRLQRRSFRRQFPPQLEGDFGQAAVGLSYRFEQVLSFVFGHVTQNFYVRLNGTDQRIFRILSDRRRLLLS